MSGRPRHDVSPERRELIERMLRKRGRAATALILRESLWLVRRIADEMGHRRRVLRLVPDWTPAEDEHLFERQGTPKPQLMRELYEISGQVRTEDQVGDRLRQLHRQALKQLRLSIAQVAELIGRSEELVVAEVERKRLRACKDGETGRRYVFPSDLRRYVDEDMDRVDWVKAAKRELVDLLRGKWGTSDEQRRGGARKAKKARRS